jgi:hypothetical protein
MKGALTPRPMAVGPGPIQHNGVIPANLPRVGHGLAFDAADAWRLRIE